ncbi:MAG: CAP domain-containing protein [Clostridia bacterium]|nr:CAP domain-containing protein [Clostridia bacterium]
MTHIRKKISTILFILALILFFLSNSNAVVTKNYKPKYGVLTDKVNFRTKPDSSSSSIIKTLAKGTSIKMVAEVSNFYIVQLGNNEIGYISKSYVNETSTPPSGAKTYTSISPFYATADSGINVRGGPSTSYRIVVSLTKGSKVQVVGSIDNFYLIVTGSNYVGMVRNDLISKVSTSTPTTTPSTPTSPSKPATTTLGDANEQLVLRLINEARAKEGLPALIMDSKLLYLSRLKAQDMVAKNYFSHTSPTYGDPFTMMKNNGVTYKTAGENIAGNPSISGAVEAWMNSPGHRKNILSTSYNYIGVGVVKSSVYGYVFVTMFIGK